MAGELLIKEWSDWSDGMGFAMDDGQNNGFAGPISASGFCLLGSKGELRPPPMYAQTNVVLNGFAEYFFTERDTAGHNYLYVTDFDPVGETFQGFLHKIRLSPAGQWGETLGSLSFTNRLAKPERYRGNWYFTELAENTRLRRLTTVAPQNLITADTIDDDGGLNNGGGHLGLAGHAQLSRFLTTGQVSILLEEQDALGNLWGAGFPVADSDSDQLGIASVSGMTFAYNTRGLYTFNDRGQAGVVSEDLVAWEALGGRGPQLVSWNGSGFDLPVLHYRALKLGIAAQRYWEQGEHDKEFRWNNYLNRYHMRHLDLMDVLSGFQMRAAARLDDVASMLGFPGKMGMSGASVWKQYQDGNIEGIRNYCETDVMNTYLVYLRYELMRGHLTDAMYEELSEELYSFCKAQSQPHFTHFLSGDLASD